MNAVYSPDSRCMKAALMNEFTVLAGLLLWVFSGFTY